jgi:hypothetical protein
LFSAALRRLGCTGRERRRTRRVDEDRPQYPEDDAADGKRFLRHGAILSVLVPILEPTGQSCQRAMWRLPTAAMVEAGHDGQMTGARGKLFFIRHQAVTGAVQNRSCLLMKTFLGFSPAPIVDGCGFFLPVPVAFCHRAVTAHR